ncbi:unnamed protein product [Adineta steineri]|uniref:Decapping nuclease n=3 Tax=Adineta steineri TaxID=433720 RepID=A0A814EAL0_9BILA|nr:unnamed protein product [Adineta steineri]CAF0968287.1 unnamed protein product [Adineta steineri]CAF3960022.1 unnamed protein product [Adineta steineri]
MPDQRDSEDYSDESPSDDYDVSNKHKANQNDYSTTNKSQNHVAARNYSKNIAVQPSAVPKCSSDSRETFLKEYDNERRLNDRQPPIEILEIFSNVKPKKEVMRILKGIQDEEEHYRQSKDEHGNRTTSKNRNAFPREPIIEHFKQVHYADFEQEDGKQILSYLRKPILRRSLYGVLLFNSEKKILVIQNHYGIWSAPKDHRKIDNNFQLETIIETVSRAFNEQIRAKHSITDEIFEHYDLQENQHLDSQNYIEKQVDSRPDSDYAKVIGLFISHFDQHIVEFELRDAYENQVSSSEKFILIFEQHSKDTQIFIFIFEACQWLAIDDIVNHIADDEFDMYFTLRPFIEDIRRRMEFDNTNRNDHYQQRSPENEQIIEENLNNVGAAMNQPDINLAQLANQLPRDKNTLPISDEVFNRSQQPIVFDDYRCRASNEGSLTELSNKYEPKVLASFNHEFPHPTDHTDIEAHERSVLRVCQIPYYQEPKLNSVFPPEIRNTTDPPPELRNTTGPPPKPASLLPLLITAHRNNVDIRKYNIVSERNSFRKIAMNKENYVISVKRFGTTLFLRRHDNQHRNVDDVGHRFERMCKPDYNLDASYNLLVEGNIGTLKTLIIAETDAVRRWGRPGRWINEAIELKSRGGRTNIYDRRDTWLQTFLGGATTVIVGQRTFDEPPLFVDIREYVAPSLIDREAKNEILRFLYQVLRFLLEKVEQGGTYLFSRRHDHRVGRHGLYLYRLADEDEHEFTFITTYP